MKKFLTVFLLLNTLLQSGFAQDTDYKKRSTLGVNFFFDDFNGAQYIKTYGLNRAIRDKQIAQGSSMSPGLAVSFLKGLTNNLDFSTTLAGSFLDYPMKGKGSFGNDNFLLEWDASINAKLLPDKYWVTPYLSAGVGASKYKGYYGAIMPVGLGMQVNFYDEAFIFINGQYRFGITENTSDHLYYSIGVAGSIGPKKEVKVVPPPPIPVVVTDRDGDGVVDSLDLCPDQPGLAKFAGCPDTDNDGIADKDDKCPTIAGLARYQGCPVPDRDHDGINDEEDKCPDVAGFARYQGCPVPDTDGDGVNDEEDKCPNVAGPKDNFGCPVIGIKSYEIVFKSNSAILLPAGKLILDTVVAYLNRNKGVNVTIDGHTDNSGNDKINNPLSVKRAEATKAYIVSKGIDAGRMVTNGYGSTKPIADNKTKEGKRMNRRIEIKIQ